MLFPTEKARDVPDRRLIGAILNRVQAMPDVCQAVRRQRVDFVLTGGDMHVWGRLDHAKDYAGIDAIATSADFPVVATAGPYTLRSVPSCRA